ncbi:hypothetical protein AMTRI_Chr10g6190 [Amborella trichopoda]
MRHGLALGQFLNQLEDWGRKRGSGSQLELLLHNSHAPSIVVVVMLLSSYGCLGLTIFIFTHYLLLHYHA